MLDMQFNICKGSKIKIILSKGIVHSDLQKSDTRNERLMLRTGAHLHTYTSLQFPSVYNIIKSWVWEHLYYQLQNHQNNIFF
jgi:hypothetical protein